MWAAVEAADEHMLAAVVHEDQRGTGSDLRRQMQPGQVHALLRQGGPDIDTDGILAHDPDGHGPQAQPLRHDEGIAGASGLQLHPLGQLMPAGLNGQ